MLVERKVCFIPETDNQGRRQTHVQRPAACCQSVGKSFEKGVSGVYGWREGLQEETAQSALTVVLKLVMKWSDQCHFDFFKYS